MRTSTLGLAFLLAACSSPRDNIPRIAELYSQAAQSETRNPVVVIHGILGARLEQTSTGKTVWGAFTADGIDPDTNAGTRALALPLVPPGSAHDHDPEQADVRAAGPLEALKLNFLFSVLSVEVYAAILRTLGAGGYTDNVVMDPLSPAYSEDHFTCFSFFYDWRRDNVENAIRFGAFLAKTRQDIDEAATRRVAKLRAAGGAANRAAAEELEAWLAKGFRFDVVAHSMGGLVARYFLRYGAEDLPADGSPPAITWAGAEQIDRLILVSTPSLGAMDALRNLVEGYDVAFILPHFHPGILGTMPSIYQLLPRTRHRLVLDDRNQPTDVNLFDPEVWDQNRWGLLDPDSDRYLQRLEPTTTPAERRAKAKQYLSWCLSRAKRFHEALDQKPDTPPPTHITLFAADTEDTLTRTRLVERGGRLVPEFDGAKLNAPGDATVPRYSAVADERQGTTPAPMFLRSPVPWSNVTFLADDHIGITSNPHFSNNTLFLLLETPPPPRVR